MNTETCFCKITTTHLLLFIRIWILYKRRINVVFVYSFTNLPSLRYLKCVEGNVYWTTLFHLRFPWFPLQFWDHLQEEWDDLARYPNITTATVYLPIIAMIIASLSRKWDDQEFMSRRNVKHGLIYSVYAVPQSIFLLSNLAMMKKGCTHGTTNMMPLGTK